MDVPKETVTLLSEGDALQIPTDTASWTFYRVETGSIGKIACSNAPAYRPTESVMGSSLHLLLSLGFSYQEPHALQLQLTCRSFKSRIAGCQDCKESK